jgi:alpha-amylase
MARALYLPVRSLFSARSHRTDTYTRIITDRYALPTGSNIDPRACTTAAQTWCGGTWAGIAQNLDYVQRAGFTAIWISPVAQNYEGARTAYGDPYHGYWVQDVSALNTRFGTADDLKQLVDEAHRRGMYVMVDVVANNVMAVGTKPDYSRYMFKDPVSPLSVFEERGAEMACAGGLPSVLPRRLWQPHERDELLARRH